MSDYGDLYVLCEKYGIFLKDNFKILINIKMPASMCNSSKLISNWEILEKIHMAVRPFSFLQLKIVININEEVSINGELNSQDDADKIVGLLNNKKLKLSGFFDSFLLTAVSLNSKNYDPKVYKHGLFDCLNTIHLKSLPTLWFSSSKYKLETITKPNYDVVKDIFSKFGSIVSLYIPVLNPLYIESNESFSNVLSYTSNVTTLLTFDAFIRYENYSEFCRALDFLRHKKLVYRDAKHDSKNILTENWFYADISVDVDQKKHLSSVSVAKRDRDLIEFQKKNALKSDTKLLKDKNKQPEIKSESKELVQHKSNFEEIVDKHEIKEKFTKRINSKVEIDKIKEHTKTNSKVDSKVITNSKKIEHKYKPDESDYSYYSVTDSSEDFKRKNYKRKISVSYSDKKSKKLKVVSENLKPSKLEIAESSKYNKIRNVETKPEYSFNNPKHYHKKLSKENKKHKRKHKKSHRYSSDEIIIMKQTKSKTIIDSDTSQRKPHSKSPSRQQYSPVKQNKDVQNNPPPNPDDEALAMRERLLRHRLLKKVANLRQRNASLSGSPDTSHRSPLSSSMKLDSPGMQCKEYSIQMSLQPDQDDEALAIRERLLRHRLIQKLAEKEDTRKSEQRTRHYKSSRI